MKYAYIKITPNGEIKLVKKETHYFSLDELHKEVECNTIQIVKPQDTAFRDLLMVIDDDGKLKGRPVNMLGTLIYNNPLDFLVGNVIIGTSFSENITDEPDVFAMPIEIAEKLKKLLKK